MATLTTSWQSFASASYSTGSSTVYFYLEARYTSQSTANNTTNIQTRLRSELTSGYISGAGYKFSCSYASTVSGSGTWNFDDEVITSGSATITHNSDGTKSISLSASAYNKYWNFTKNLSATVTLPKINRIATVTSGTDFNDETNPKITFTNPANYQLVPYINFYHNGSLVIHIERPKGSYTSPYAWELTEQERQDIRDTLTTVSSQNVIEGLFTYNGNSNIGASSVIRRFTFVNANPTMAYTTTETNTDVSSLLGSSSADTIIQNISKVEVAVTPTALKSATISKVAVTNSGVTLTDTTSPYELEFDITNSDFSITTTDSRGLTVSDSFTKTLIPYQKVKSNSFSFKRINPTSSNVKLLVDSVYYQQTFGSTSNVPTIKWKLDDGNWNTIPNSQYTIDTANNKLTLDYTINNVIDYRNNGTFYIEVSDLLSSWTNSNKISKGIPVMERGNDEVQINGDLLLADINRDSVINVRDALGGSGGTTDYTLLTNKPQINGNTLTGNLSTSDLGITIPTVNNGKLTFSKDNAKVTEFTANSSTNVNVDLTNEVKDVQINGTSILSNKEANIRTNSTYNSSTNKIATMDDIPTIPTTVSSFTNDAGYITRTVNNLSNYTNNATLGSVLSGYQTKIDSSNKLDYSLISNTPTIPSKTSELTNDSNFVDTSYHDSSKQDTLVSGTNIKTINGATLLGSGDITIGGGGTSTDVKINGTSITSGGEANIQTNGTYNSSTNKIATMNDLPSVPVQDVQVNGTSILSSGNANLVTNSAYDSTTNKIATISDIPTPNIMTMYLQTNFKLSANNTYYDVTGFAQGVTVGNKLTFNNNRIYIGSGVSKVKVCYSAKIQSVNTTRTFVYLSQNGNRISQEGWWPGASGQQSTVGVTSRVLNVDEGDYFNLHCYGTTNTLIVGKGTADFVPTTLTVEVIE